MAFARKLWHFLVAVKDGLVLLLLLLFFTALFGLLSLRPSVPTVQDGALNISLDGPVVEEMTAVDPLSVLLSGSAPESEYQVRDIIRAIDSARDDDRIQAITLDLSRFPGGGQVHLTDIGEALDRFRATGMKVLAFSTAYTDDGLLLAAHADEIWADPMGGAVVTGPGGESLYYGGLIEKLKINAHIFRVGTYKSAVEPYLRDDMSDAAREDRRALYGALWEEWRADVAKSRPVAKLNDVTRDPVGWIAAANGDLAKASKSAGLIDHVGDRVAFGNRVAELVGEDASDDLPGNFAHTSLRDWLEANPRDKPGKAIGVVTIAGDIVDGDAGPGAAGGDRIAEILDEAMDEDLAALVVRVDSPGGSVTASEEIRRAILRQKARGIPVAVSMANVAASGGYWVSTPADRIFAEPATITGSIGIFAIIPTFERTLADWGVTTDGVRTTPLSGQPDLAAGLTPEAGDMLQAVIEDNYARFLNLVAKSRNKTPAEIDRIAQGRVWAGGAARQVGLIDEFGNIDDALAWAAKTAKLDDGDWHAQYLGIREGPFQGILAEAFRPSDDGSAALDPVAAIALNQKTLIDRVTGDLGFLLGNSRAQAFCLACPVTPAAGSARARREEKGLFARIAALLD